MLFFRKKMGSRNPVDIQNHRKEEKTFLQENGVDLMIRVHDTGIGMAITDQLVQLMGGEIVVESLKDKGSDFTVFLQLPLAEEGSIEEKTTTENQEQNADTGNDMDTVVAEVAELLRSLFLWKKTVLKENL